MDDFVRKYIAEKLFKKTGEDRCVFCKQKVGEFKNEESIREYRISGVCQDCQDRFFDSRVPLREIDDNDIF